ncbi:hypothetical protein DITRI_Ditri18aG0104200 [Diplodiscus trichospermus]
MKNGMDEALIGDEISVWDEDIEHRYSIIRKEAETIYEVSSVLGIVFYKIRKQMIDVFQRIPIEKGDLKSYFKERLIIRGQLRRCGLENIYAPNDDDEMAVFWEMLVALMRSVEVPWCIGGDFNVVRSPEEKVRAGFNLRAMSLFSNFIENAGMVDLPLQGGRFTWSSNRNGEFLGGSRSIC